MKAPLPDNETGRLQALHRYDILDTLPEKEFDDIAFLAAQICQAPVALISFVDSDRQWFKARVGVEMSETPREISFCAHAILDVELFSIPDASLDPRFADNPLVMGEPQVRFYSGAPLVTPDGFALGTLCIIDLKPRVLSDEQTNTLRILSRHVVAQLELRRHLQELQQALQQRDRALQAVAEHERQLSTVVEHASNGILTLDVGGYITTSNPAARAIFGLSPQEISGQRVSPFLPDVLDASAPEVWDYLREHDASQNGGQPRFVTVCRSDGTSVTTEWALSEVELGGVRQLVALVRDVTEMHRIEQLKSDFISTVSHELRTPLTSIHGALSLMRGPDADTNGQSSFDSAHTQALVDIAYKNSERLVTLINDILDLSKIEAGRLDFNFQLLDIGLLVSEAVAMQRPLAESVGVCIDLAPASTSCIVRADPHRLMQVMANLLSNAIKFSQDGQQVQVWTQVNASHVRVFIEDHGPGIREELRSRIFDKFEMGDSSNTRKYGGSGLGLSLCKAILGRMGGSIDFESRRALLGSHEVSGTTFFFELPCATS
jgi:PAS domain S-box-containing protein